MVTKVIKVVKAQRTRETKAIKAIKARRGQAIKGIKELPQPQGLKATKEQRALGELKAIRATKAIKGIKELPQPQELKATKESKESKGSKEQQQPPRYSLTLIEWGAGPRLLIQMVLLLIRQLKHLMEMP
jgi:hypothetical protein